MFNLPALLRSVQERVKPPVLVLLGSPNQAATLCAALGDIETVCYQVDLHQAGKLRRLLEEHASPTTDEPPPETEDLSEADETEPEKPDVWVAPKELTSKVVVEVKPDVWDLPPRFNTVIFPVSAHGEREFKLDLLEQAYHVLAPKGVFISLSEYQKDQLLPKAHKKLFGKCSELPASKLGSVFWSVQDGDKPRRRHQLTYNAKIAEGPSHTFISRPGVFGYGELDKGARALLEAAEIKPGDRVLDLGCGVGSVGVLAMDRAGAEGHVTFVDSNIRALAVSAENATANGVKDFTCHASVSIDGLSPASFDVVLANPPYYANSWIAQMFIEKARELLKPGGRLFLVTKMVNHVAPVMAEIFPDSTWEERRGYYVMRGDAT
ncbi:class I SAM-dependent methyltransferase [Zavarzinella formosa]|uniref:class I SAM-dependent methyltransferase n=1 Tax=Zavarzinella formosa TaxID=360055 RepID=UPI0002D66C8B|nr:methyltransferase [Zavarzinella formosa]